MLSSEANERQRFWDKYAEELASSKIGFKTSASNTTSSMIWTCRNTGCDVISIITTVVPIKGGLMRDIKQANLEPKNRANAMRKGKSSLLASPLEEGLVVDVNLVRKKISAKLKAEKRAFMQRLNVSRNIRSKVESNAAVKIQAIYRGHATRCKVDENIARCTVGKAVRSKLLSFLREAEQQGNNNVGSFIKDWFAYRFAYSQKRHANALKIQCAFRRFVSRRTLALKRRDMALYRAHMSIIRIQAMSRKAIARIWAKKVAADAKFNLRKNAARKIENKIRCFLARRRVQRRRLRLHWVAARMIQCWFRAIRARRLCFVIRKRTLQWKQFFATRKFQCMIRKFLSRKRVGRMHARTAWLKRYKATACIQRRIRGILSRIRVRKLRALTASARQRALEEKKQIEAEAAAKKKQQDDLDLLQGIDIFYQAKQGKITEVDDILHGRVTDDPPSPNQTDGSGDTILTIAARIGNAELVRKCLQWGCLLNHRNSAGFTALMIAVKHQQPEVVQYLLYVQDDGSVISDLSRDEAGTLLVAAAGGNSDTSREILKALLAKELSPSCTSPELGQTALHAAAEVGDMEAVMMLIKARAVIEVFDDLGQTPLHKACASSLEVFSYLLQFSNGAGGGVGGGAAGAGGVSALNSLKEAGSVDGMTVDVESGAPAAVVDGAPGSPALNVNKDLLTPAPETPQPGSMLRQPSFANTDGSATIATSANSPNPAAATAGGDATADASIAETAAVDFRVAKVLRADQDGKDCLLLALIHGQTAIYESCVAILNGSDIVYTAPEEIGWTPNDISKAMTLAKTGNTVCLEQLLNAGFDATWAVEESGITLAMTACLHGQVSVLELLLSKGIDLTVCDTTILGRSAIHYAAQCVTDTGMVEYLLTHTYAKACKITDKLLSATDSEGRMVLHLAAIVGNNVRLPETLASDAIIKLLEARDKDGMTPLLLACSYLQPAIITAHVKTFAAASSSPAMSSLLLKAPVHIDPAGHDCLWHVFHPHASVYTSRARPVVCSEYLSRSHPADTLNYIGGTLTRRQDAVRVAEDMDTVQLLLKYGCKLFSDAYSFIGTEDADSAELKRCIARVDQYVCDEKYRNSVMAMTTPIEPPAAPATAGAMTSTSVSAPEDVAQAGEVLIREKSLTFLRVLPDICSVQDCWRLLLAAILFDTELGCPCLCALIEGGLLDTLIRRSNTLNFVTERTAAEIVNDIMARSIPSSPNVAGDRRPYSMESHVTLGAETRTPMPPKCTPKEAFEYLLKLHDVSILGWAIRALNNSLVTHLLETVGVDPAILVDDEQNNALHYVGKYGTAEMCACICQRAGLSVAKVFASMVRPTTTTHTFTLDGVKVQSVAFQDPSATNTSATAKQLQALINSMSALVNNNGNNNNPLSLTNGGMGGNSSSSGGSVLRLEATNAAGRTAATEAALRGHLGVLRELIMRRASARTALMKGKYWAFLLALARRQEKVEVNMQTGVIESDDAKYSCVKPDPNYVTWYQQW